MKRLRSRDGSSNDDSDESNSSESSDDDDDDLCSTGSQDGERQSEGQGLTAAFLPIPNDAVDQPSRVNGGAGAVGLTPRGPADPTPKRRCSI